MKYIVDTQMPLPNRPGTVNNRLLTTGAQRDRDMFVARVDHTFGQNDTVFFRMLEQRVSEFVPNVSGYYNTQNRYDVSNYGAGWNHVFSPTAVLEVKYGFSHPDNPGCPSLHGRADTRRAFRIRQRSPSSTRPPFATPASAYTPQGYYGAGGGGGETILDRNHQFNGKFTKIIGRHNMKMGGGYTWRNMDASYANPTNGDAEFWIDPTSSANTASSGNSFATMLLGYPSYIRRGFTIPSLFAQQHYFEGFYPGRLARHRQADHQSRRALGVRPASLRQERCGSATCWSRATTPATMPN